MRLQFRKEQGLVPLGNVRPAASSARDEAGPPHRRRPPRVEPLPERFANHRRRRSSFPLCVELQIAFSLRREEDRGPFHMTYDIIPHCGAWPVMDGCKDVAPQDAPETPERVDDARPVSATAACDDAPRISVRGEAP